MTASDRDEFCHLLRRCPGAVPSISAANELTNLGGGPGTRHAPLLAPPSLVQAIGSTTTRFAFGFGVPIPMLRPALARADLSRPELVHKGVAAVLVRPAPSW